MALRWARQYDDLKKCPRRGEWRGQTKHIQFRDMFQKETLPVQLEKRHSLHVGKRFIGRL